MSLPVCWSCLTENIVLTYQSYYHPKYADKAGFDWLLIVKASCCGATKVVMPSCLVGEQGIGDRKKEKIILALCQAGLNQKEIAKQFEVSGASVSRIKNEIVRLLPTRIISEIKNLKEGTEKGPLCLTASNLRSVSASVNSARTKTIRGNYELIKLYGTLYKTLHPETRYIHSLSLWRLRARKSRTEFILRI